MIPDHNMENMSEVSRFHWLSHLLTEKYELKTEYTLLETKDSRKKQKFLERGSIQENIVLIVYVNMPRMTGEKSGACGNRKLVKKNRDERVLEIQCGIGCEQEQCNFLCKWFGKKNDYLFRELDALQNYLNDLPDNYFTSKVTVQVRYEENNPLTAQQFTMLRNFVTE